MSCGNKIGTYVFNGCCGFMVVLGLFLIVFKFAFLEDMIKSLAAQGVVMNNDTYNLWGVIPGDTETFTLRNFSIFNFTNPHEFLYNLNGNKTKIP